jgi:hypothetical protein
MQKPTIMIPSSIQRIRCFMKTEGGLKVKPWITVEETLDAFYSLLTTNNHNDTFWQKLDGLLSDISGDLKTRLQADDRVVDNEVLNTAQYADLLAEIRATLPANSVGKGAFRAGLSRLSAPATALLLLMGGITTTGCMDLDGSNYDGKDTTNIHHSEGDDTDTDSDIFDSSSTAQSSDGVEGSLEEIVREVIPDENTQEALKDCIDKLHESWQTGLEELFQGETEGEIEYQLSCLIRGCQDPDAMGEYALDTLLDNCAVVIYLGVKFE